LTTTSAGEGNVWRMWTLLLIAYSYLLLEAVEHWAEYAAPNQHRVSLGQAVAYHKREAISTFQLFSQ
jgi:hypothetical protein